MKKLGNKIQSNKKISKLAITLYVVAAILAIYSCVTLYSSYTYIASLVEAGSIVVSDQLLDIIHYCMGETMPYVFYTIVLWAIGYIINILNGLYSINKNSEIDSKIDQ